MVSEQIAKKLKPHAEGEFVECLKIIEGVFLFKTDSCKDSAPD